MRGSETVKVRGTFTPGAPFLIPMRGSEDKNPQVKAIRTKEFLIPMRGSEFQAGRGSAEAVDVPDPHEG